MSASTTTARRNAFLFELKRLALEAQLSLQCLQLAGRSVELGPWRIVVDVVLLRQLGNKDRDVERGEKGDCGGAGI